MPLKTLSPRQAHALIARGAVLVDVRSIDEHARERIAEARHVPLEQLAMRPLSIQARTVIFHCRSGHRTRLQAGLLAACVQCDETYVLEGGLDGWKQAGLPVLKDRRQPLELQRQVQIAAGGLALAGTLLGALVSPWFHLVPGLVGAGLVLAGLTGFCGMARLLMKMPWNRPVS